MAPRPRGVRFHLGGRVRLEPPRVQTGPGAGVLFRPRRPADGFGPGVSQPRGSGRREAAVQGTRGVHERLDRSQRRNRQVRAVVGDVVAYLNTRTLTYARVGDRISQDLAKDLAMLAREIHDVAGEIDSVSPAATDPGILVVSNRQNERGDARLAVGVAAEHDSSRVSFVFCS